MAGRIGIHGSPQWMSKGEEECDVYTPTGRAFFRLLSNLRELRNRWLQRCFAKGTEGHMKPRIQPYIHTEGHMKPRIQPYIHTCKHPYTSIYIGLSRIGLQMCVRRHMHGFAWAVMPAWFREACKPSF